MDTLKREYENIKSFWKSYGGFSKILALVVVVVYGLRAVKDTIFLDSELMIGNPELMQQVWLGSNRFGMVLTSRLFGMSRLVPYLSGILMMIMMWISGMALSYAVREWSGRSRRYDAFTRLFPLLFITMPVFAEQYIFILQAFEISVGIFLAIVAVYCTGQFVYRKQKPFSAALWLAVGSGAMVWSFGTYQAMVPLYICLVLLSFLLVYMRGDSKAAFFYGIRHTACFVAGCALYVLIIMLVRQVTHSRSTYVEDMFRWNVDSFEQCLQAIKHVVRRDLLATTICQQKYYLPAMCLFVLQCMYYGWNEKKQVGDFLCFLFGGGLFLLSPFLLTIITGSVQAMRTELVYPAAAAAFLAHLTVPPKEKRGRFTAVAAVICAFFVMRQSVTTVQLFQTASEVYRNDVITATQMYGEIRQAADREDMSQCMVIFTGGKGAGLQGPVIRGDLIGMSLFEAEAHTEVGVTGRVAILFRMLGLPMQVLSRDQKELYWQADAFMTEMPSWPAKGSVQKMGDIVVVKLSESRLPSVSN